MATLEPMDRLKDVVEEKGSACVSCLKISLVIGALALLVFTSGLMTGGVFGIVGNFSIAPAWMSSVTVFLTYSGSIAVVVVSSTGALLTILVGVVSFSAATRLRCSTQHEEPVSRDLSTDTNDELPEIETEIGQEIAGINKKLGHHEYAICRVRNGVAFICNDEEGQPANFLLSSEKLFEVEIVNCVKAFERYKSYTMVKFVNGERVSKGDTSGFTPLKQKS